MIRSRPYATFPCLIKVFYNDILSYLLDMTCDASEYIRMFNQFFNKGDMTATYKPIFLRSLLDLGDYDIDNSNRNLVGHEWIQIDGNTITLDLNFIATRFIKYCWDLEHSFKLKQTSNPKRATIISIIRKEQDLKNYKNPPSFETLAKDNNKELRSKVIKLCLKKQALYYLLETDMPGLCHLQKRTNNITLDVDIIQFLKEHRTLIKHGLNYKLSVLLEKLNKSIPHIAMKVDAESYPPRKLSLASEKILDYEQECRCFYCDRRYIVPKKRHIDHVIPFNYIFSTEVYNCVAACVTCNLSKSDVLPESSIFDSVLDRNDQFMLRKKELSAPLKKSLSIYDKVWYAQTYENCIADYNGNSLFFKPKYSSV